MAVKFFQGTALLLLSCGIISGCATNGNVGAGSSGLSSITAKTGVSGRVHGGQNPVSGATIQIYQVGTTGYTSPAQPILTTPVTTNAQGGFTITSSDYSNGTGCTSGTYLYITATGGNPGLGTGANASIALANAIGLCDNLSSGSYIMINELTTVAAAYSLAQFSGGTSFGTLMSAQPGSGTSAPADNFATSSANLVGLANAFATSAVLANPSTGLSPGSNNTNTATPEWWQIDMLGDMLGACVNSATGSSACTALFGNVSTNGGTAPADTLQAALYMALNPTVGATALSNLYTLVTTTAPFQPYPTTLASVIDLTVGIQYKPGGSSPLLPNPMYQIGIDSLGNVWVANQVQGGTGCTTNPTPTCNATIYELTPIGDPIQAGSTSGNYAINGYYADGSTTATTFGGNYYYNGTSYAAGTGFLPLVVDTNNNVWTYDRQNYSIVKLTGSGTTYSNSFSYANGGNAGATAEILPTDADPYGLTVDGSNNVWFQAIGPSSGTITAATCGATSWGSANKAFGGYLGGSFSNLVLAPETAPNSTAGQTQVVMAVDPNLTDTYTPSGGSATAIPGAPFIWTAGNTGSSAAQLAQAYAGTGGTTAQGCATALNFWGNGAGTAGGGAPAAGGTTQIPTITDPAGNAGSLSAFADDQSLTFDKSGNLWLANSVEDSSVNSGQYEIVNAITKLTFNYGTAFSVAQAEAHTTFSVIHNVAGMYDGSTGTTTCTAANESTTANACGWGPPAALVTDGGGNIYYILNHQGTYTNNGHINAISSTSTALSPVALTPATPFASTTKPGWFGSTCTSCIEPGTTTKATSARYNAGASTGYNPSIDASGNIWQTVSLDYVEEIVGAAVPKVTPDSLGLKNGTFAQKP